MTVRARRRAAALSIVVALALLALASGPARSLASTDRHAYAEHSRRTSDAAIALTPNPSATRAVESSRALPPGGAPALDPHALATTARTMAWRPASAVRGAVARPRAPPFPFA